MSKQALGLLSVLIVFALPIVLLLCIFMIFGKLTVIHILGCALADIVVAIGCILFSKRLPSSK